MFPHPRVRREGAGEGASRAGGQGAREGHDDTASDRTGGRAGAAPASDSAVVTARPIERLSLVEMLVAELGAWSTAIVCRCHLPVGPFLASDGAVHLDLAVFRGEPQERVEPSQPE